MEHVKWWQTTRECRQSEMFLHGLEKQLNCYALSLNRHNLRILAGLLTGHIMLNKHFTITKTRTDPLCTVCVSVPYSYWSLGGLLISLPKAMSR